MVPKISVCIPAYKNKEFLRRGLEALREQDFRDFEVIVTDDSPEPELRAFVLSYAPGLQIQYHHNVPARGTPANWNRAMELASGEWIKLIHDDDWLCSPKALSLFIETASAHPEADVIFCAYKNVRIADGKSAEVLASPRAVKRFQQNPLFLFHTNLIGPPSTIMHRRTALEYDERLKWVVDFSAYIQASYKGVRFAYIPRVLVAVGVSQQQVTQHSFRVPAVEIPENAYLLHQLGTRALHYLITFDYYWRLVRNLSLTQEMLEPFVLPGFSKAFFEWLIKKQKPIPRRLLTNGIISKTGMLMAYFTCPFRKL